MKKILIAYDGGEPARHGLENEHEERDGHGRGEDRQHQPPRPGARSAGPGDVGRHGDSAFRAP